MRLTGAARILQLHPTRRCNLQCLHCYSDSSPRATDELPESVVLDVVADAAALGYSVLSVSGGEPFLYRSLARVLAAARSAGLRNQVITNGLLLDALRLDGVAEHLDLLAISIDGAPDDHDRMRGQDGTFERLESRLRCVRDSGIPFGLLFTLTMYNVHQLAWAAEFAASLGARFLQVHPLERSGRGSDLGDEIPDDVELGFALVEAARLQVQYRDGLTIHVDITTAHQLTSVLGTPDRDPAHFADLVSPLVVEPDGECVPFEYGFPRALALGNVLDDGLASLASAWRVDHAREVHGAMVAVADLVATLDDGAIVDAYAELKRIVLSSASTTA